MFDFTEKQKIKLRDIGRSHNGNLLTKILDEVKVAISDVTTISSKIPSSDIATHVEARKLLKAFIIALQDTMNPIERTKIPIDDIDEYE